MEMLVRAQELAVILKLSTRRVNQLAKLGVLKKNSEGKFNLPKAAEAYYSFKYKPKTDSGYREEQCKHEAAKREKAELELDRLKNSLLYAADIEHGVSTMNKIVRSHLLELPARIAPRVIGQKQLSVISAILTEEVHAALTELASIPGEIMMGTETQQKKAIK